MILLVTCVACVCAAALAGATPTAAESRPRAASLASPALLDAVITRTRAPGGVVAVEGPTGRWIGARGLADLERRTPMTRASRFRIGDVTQAFVGVALLDAIHQDWTHLEERASEWLYALDDEVRIRHLYLHTSGLLRSGGVMAGGRRFHYNPQNYVLLAAILEAATGSAYANRLRTRVLRPLKLAATAYDPRVSVPRLARGHTSTGRPTPKIVDPKLARATAIVSTPADLVRFVRIVLSGRFLAERRTRELTTFTAAVRGFPADRFGLGLFRVRTPCGPAWGHRGREAGSTTWMFATPDGERAVAAAVNVGGLKFARVLDAERAIRVALCA